MAALGSLAKAGAKAAKVGAKAGAKSMKVGGKVARKGAKSAKSGAKTAAKVAKKNPKLLKTAAAAAVVGGGALYLDKKLKDQSQAIKDCVQVCLPEGYDGVAFGGKPASTLQYRTIESLKAGGADVDEKQPLCTADVGECGEFCSTKCKEANPLDVPGAGVAGAAVGAVKGAAGFLGKGIWSVIKIPVMIMCALITLAIIAKIAMSGKRAAVPPPPRYY